MKFDERRVSLAWKSINLPHGVDWINHPVRDEDINSLWISSILEEGETFRALGNAYPNLERLHFDEAGEDNEYFTVSEEIMRHLPRLKSLKIYPDDPSYRLFLHELDMGPLRLEFLHMSVETSWKMDVSHVKHLVLDGRAYGGVTLQEDNSIESICALEDFFPDGVLMPHLTHFHLFEEEYVVIGTPMNCQRLFDLAPSLKVFGTFGPNIEIKSSSLEVCSLKDSNVISLDCPRLHTLELTRVPQKWHINAPELTVIRFRVSEKQYDEEDEDDPWGLLRESLGGFLNDLKQVKTLVLLLGESDLGCLDYPEPLSSNFLPLTVQVVEGVFIHPVWG